MFQAFLNHLYVVNLLILLAGESSIVIYSVFFFFQAEDGIRDYKVTGVQTCALPIYGLTGQSVDTEDHDSLTVSHFPSHAENLVPRSTFGNRHLDNLARDLSLQRL